MSVSNDAHLRVKVEDDAEAVIFNGAEMVDIQNGSSSPSIEDQSQVNNQKRYLAAVVYVQQPGVESVPGDSSANINKSAGNQLQECVPNREEASSEIRSCEARRTSGEYSYVYRPKRRKITVCNAPQMRTRDTGDYADYEENGDFVYDYSADYECASDMSESSFVTDQQRTLVEVLNYCQVMYAAIQRLDKKFDVLHRRVTEMHEGRTKPMFFKPRLMTSHGNSHQMSLTKMKMQKPAERQVRIRMPPPDQGICSSPLRIRVEKEPLNISVQSSTAQPLTNPETTYSCTRATSPPLPTIHSVLSLQEPSMQGSATAVGISDLVPVKTIVKQDTGVPKLSGANDTGRLYQDGYSSRDTETFVNGNTTNGTEQQSNLSEQLSCAPSSSAANMNFDYLGDPRRNIKVPAAFLIKARQKSKPKYAARYLIRMMFPRDVLMCSNMQGDKARGIKPLDSNRVNALREFLGTLFPTFDLNEEGKDWKTCVTSVNSMIRSLRYETQRAANITSDKAKTLGSEGAQVCINLYSDNEESLIPSERLEEPKVTTEPQQQEWNQQDVTTVPENDKQKAFELKETLGNPARQVQLPYSAVYVAKQRLRPELAARCLIRHLFPEEVLVRSNVYGNLDRGIAPLDCNKICAVREFLEEAYPVFDLRENGRDWKACVAAINSSIRSIRHDLRKSLPGYNKKQHPQYLSLYSKKQPDNQSNKMDTPHSTNHEKNSK
ncbi:uncharacterized protein [Mobula birostris]|uniref:uncharacterized protein isoform X1 n=1 Tax=Mobula birostris TaxID=1983395 RepID=UPI003B27BC61